MFKNNLSYLYLFRDKKIFDKNSSRGFRQRSIFGKLKPPIEAQSKRPSMSLPPSFRLNRQNSTHVPAASTAQTNGQKFPWGRKGQSDEEDDRLSTISSKDDSHEGDKRRRKQDNECQTDDVLFQAYLKSSSIRRRRPSTSSKKSFSDHRSIQCHSESSIDSDEIFLSLPTSGGKEERGMFKTSPNFSDRSPLISQNQLRERQNGRRDQASNGSYNYVTDIQLHNERDKDHVIYPSNKISVKQLVKPDMEVYNNLNKFSQRPLNAPCVLPDMSPNAVQPIGLTVFAENGPCVKMKNASNPEFSLKPAESALYNRRHSENSHNSSKDDNSSCNYRRYTVNSSNKPSNIKRRNGSNNSVSEIQPLLSPNCLQTYQPFVDHQRSRRGSKEMCIRQCAFDADSVLGSPPSIQNVDSSIIHPLINLDAHVTPPNNTIVSMENIQSLGLNELDEEEVSMISFQNYLKERGVQLDMSSVQSSEV